MERRVKERLVGAAVLVSAAVILIPEMLSGPARTRDETLRQNDAPLKTYTIDLSRSPGAVAPIDDRAPPQEPSVPAPTAASAQNDDGRKEVRDTERTDGPQGLPEASASRPAAESPPAPSGPVRSAEAAKPKSAEATKPKSAATQAATQVPREPVAQSSVPKTPGWAVQVGSFASRATAERLAKELKESGHNAFVMPVKSGNTTLYRVRIGPFGDRAKANDVLASVKTRIANAAVVTHP